MKKLFYLVAVATLSVLSCQKEVDQEKVVPNDSAIVFTASVEDLNSITKADIDDFHDLIWAPDDKIGVYVNDASWNEKNQPFVLEGVGGTSNGSFYYEYGDFDNTNANVAFFPWQGQWKAGVLEDVNNVNTYETSFRVYYKLPGDYGTDDEPTYTSGMMFTPLAAKITRTNDHYNPITFMHAGAAVKITTDNLPAGSHSIKMTAAQQIHGYYHLDYDNIGEEAMVLNEGAQETANNTIWLHFAPETQPRPFTFLFPVPSLGENVKLSFAIYDKNDVLVWSRSASNHGALANGDVLVLDTDADIEPYRQINAVSSEWTVIGPAGWSEDIEMITDGTSCIVTGMALAAGAEFKIRKNKAWDENYGGSNLKNSAAYAGLGNDYNVRVIAEGVYDIVFNTVSHNIFVAPTGECPYPAQAHHYTAIKNATELGTTETANCYVIAEPGSYKIPVVKGNSSEAAGVVGGVELLWETYNNGTSVTANSVIEAVDWDERTPGYIYFKTPATLKPGNALIAAKDADGNIIWSWHIWIPETSIEDIGEYEISTKYYMDRNLGALKIAIASTSADVVSESLGMYYEWGRKDPFMGPRAINSGSLAKYAGTAINSTSASVDMAYSIAHPTTYAKNNDWNDGVTDCWGQGAGKTIYDPCPAGYRIPEYNSSELLWQDVTTNSTFAANGAHGWWKVGSSFVFPMAGEGGSDYADHVYDRNKVWTAAQLSETDNQYGLGQYIYYKNTDPKDTWTSDEQGSWQSKPSWGVRKRYLASVRCQKIEGTVPEPEAPVPTPATGITLDGDMSDWSDGDEIDGDGTNILKWKYAYDASNVYFYFKIPTSKIKFETSTTSSAYLSYRHKRYIYIALDTDAKESTGANPGTGEGQYSYGGLTLNGCDALALVYPFMGTAPSASSTPPEGLEFVNGSDDQGWTRVPPTGGRSGKLPVAYGIIDGSYAYLEVGLPMDGLGSPSPSKMKLQFSYSWDLAGVYTIEIK